MQASRVQSSQKRIVVNQMLPALFALALFPALAHAQYIGANVDRVASTIDWQYPKPPAGCEFCIGDGAPNASRRAIGGGVVVAMRAQRNLGLSSEVTFSPRGYAVTQPTLEMAYLSFPNLMRVGRLVNEDFPLSVFVEGGVAPALRLDCRVKYNSTSEECFNGAAFGQNYHTRRFDVSAIAGIGVGVRLGRRVVALRIRGDAGLVNIGESQGVPTKHRAFTLSAAWLTPLQQRSK
jgi:hypothetical protein